jgi:hypothetical protein
MSPLAQPTWTQGHAVCAQSVRVQSMYPTLKAVKLRGCVHGSARRALKTHVPSQLGASHHHSWQLGAFSTPAHHHRRPQLALPAQGQHHQGKLPAKKTEQSERRFAAAPGCTREASAGTPSTAGTPTLQPFRAPNSVGQPPPLFPLCGNRCRKTAGVQRNVTTPRGR